MLTSSKQLFLMKQVSTSIKVSRSSSIYARRQHEYFFIVGIHDISLHWKISYTQLLLGGLMVMLLIQSLSLVVAIVVFSLGQLPCPSSRSGMLWMPTIILSFMFSFLLICQRLFRLVFPLYVLITFHPFSMARKHSRRFNTGVVYWYEACFYTPYHCSVCRR